MADATLETSAKDPRATIFKLCALTGICGILLLSSEMRGLLIDVEAAIPFLGLLAIPITMALIQRRNLARALTVSFVPIGIAVCVYCMFATLMNLGQPSDVSSLLRQLYAPLVFGLFFSYALKLAEPVNSRSHPPSPWWQVLAIFGLAYFVFGFSLYARFEHGLTDLWNLRAVIITLAITLGCLAYNLDNERLHVNKVLARAGTLTCIASAAFGVAVYAYATDPSEFNPKVLGPAMGTMFFSMLYGSFLLLAASVCGGLPETDKEIRNRDWYLSEAYVFVTLVIFPPISLLDTFGPPSP